MKRILALTLAAVMLFAFCPGPTGLRAEAAKEAPKQEEKAPEKAPNKEPVKVSVEGEYTLFAVEVAGRQMDPAVLGMGGSIILSADGTGKLVTDGAEEKLPKWTEKDGTLTLYTSDDAKQETLLQDGIIEMEYGTGAYIYFAHEGVDTKDFKTSGHPTGSRLYDFAMSLDSEKGVHLRYRYHLDYMDSDSSFDAQAKGGSYYVLETTKVKNSESRKGTLYADGTVYMIDPAKKTGSAVMPVSPSMLMGEPLMLDKLYQVLQARLMRKDFTEEEREYDGVKYTVEVFPAEDYTEEAAFYFDKDGRLVHILVGPPKIMPEMGETFYTIEVPDDKVDETLFDLKSYKISK